MQKERIFVTYTTATAPWADGPVLGHHAVLNYIDKNGNHQVIEGKPSKPIATTLEKGIAFAGEELFSDGARRADSQFGKIQAIERQATTKDLGRPFENIYEDDDLRSKWNAIRATAATINDRGYEYRPYSQNSNTFAFVALRSAGLSASGVSYDPVSKKNQFHKLQGREFTLSNPINATASTDSVDMPDYDDMRTVTDRIGNLEGLMRDGHSEYWRGPKADTLQQEYRDLVSIRTNHEKQAREANFSSFMMVP